MLFLIHGNDTSKTADELAKLRRVLEKKRPDAEFFFMNADTFSQALFEESLNAQGLFERKVVVILDDVFLNKDAKGIVLSRIDDMAESENAFLLRESAITAKELKDISKVSQNVIEANKKKEEAYNVFTISDAVARKDARKAWVAFQEALRNGATAESIQGSLFWQVKTLILSKGAKSAKEAGLSPFPFSKAKKAAEKWSEDELAEFSQYLVDGYHCARRGEGDLDIFLEKLMLELK